MPKFFTSFLSSYCLTFPSFDSFFDSFALEILPMNPIIRLAVFASGNGSNAQRIADHFRPDDTVEISVIYSNKSDAYVLERAQMAGIPAVVINRDQFYQSDEIIDDLRSRKIDWIILAGFLWLIPTNILEQYSGRIINIHPALLPKFGGKGMYGSRVHEAVIQSGEKESGITIHFVNEKYDEGQIIFQSKCAVENSDTAETLAVKIHQLEHLYYPEVIDELIHSSYKQ